MNGERQQFSFRRRKTETVQARTPDRSRVEPITRVDESQGAQRQIRRTILESCPHGKILHDLSEVAGFCAVGDCSRALCKECAESNVCSICGRTFCVNHSRETWSGERVCSAHGFFARLFR